MGEGGRVWFDADVWKHMWTGDDEWYKHATEFYIEEEPAIDVGGALTLIKSELDDLEGMLRGYADLVSEVSRAGRRTPSKVADFTVAKKAELVEYLTDGMREFNKSKAALLTAADIKTKLTRVLHILTAAPAHVEPARAAVAAVTPVAVEEEGEVVKREEYEGYWGQGDMHFAEVRKFDASNPRGMYQRWVDGKFDRTLPDYKEARMQMGEMRGLLGRLEALG